MKRAKGIIMKGEIELRLCRGQEVKREIKRITGKIRC